MTIHQAKEIDMVDYLSRQGHQPAKISGHNYWYYSPFHDEKTPSFKVNRHMNRWYDFSEGKGGNLVDFGINYHNCSINDFLQRIDTPAADYRHFKQDLIQSPRMEAENRINVVFVSPISSFALQNYLLSRKILPEVSDKYCSEVAYSIGNKSYYAIGFKNDSGGYELRNPNFKGSSSPKDITFIDNGANSVAIFEGFFNFLSYQSLYHKQELQKFNYLVLNSASFFEKSFPVLQCHEQVQLYLDNDKTGQKLTAQVLAIDKEKFHDKRHLYRQYNDLNDWLINSGQSQKQQLKLKP